MSGALKKIYFVHEGREAYPEIAAYRAYFADQFVCEEISPTALATRADLAESIVWYIMGFHPRRPVNAGLVVHDYRSLSVGKMRTAKDWLKRLFNATPDVRIFQNSGMQEALGIRNNVPTFFLPMGVPPSILSYHKEEETEPVCDFCYIGVMSRERKTFLMLDSFLNRYGDSKTLHLYGLPEAAIVERYRQHTNIQFMGRKPQQEVFPVLRSTRVAVNYFPTHAPHTLQTPTKLLEYAALGLRILCNEQKQSRLIADAYGLHCQWGPAHDMFRYMPNELTWPDNRGFDPSPLLWPAVIGASGIDSYLRERSGA